MEIELTDFTGSKIALICGRKGLTILRDDKEKYPLAQYVELPVVVEGDESPFEWAARSL